MAMIDRRVFFTGCAALGLAIGVPAGLASLPTASGQAAPATVWQQQASPSSAARQVPRASATTAGASGTPTATVARLVVLVPSKATRPRVKPVVRRPAPVAPKKPAVVRAPAIKTPKESPVTDPVPDPQPADPPPRKPVPGPNPTPVISDPPPPPPG